MRYLVPVTARVELNVYVDADSPEEAQSYVDRYIDHLELEIVKICDHEVHDAIAIDTPPNEGYES